MQEDPAGALGGPSGLHVCLLPGTTCSSTGVISFNSPTTSGTAMILQMTRLGHRGGMKHAQNHTAGISEAGVNAVLTLEPTRALRFSTSGIRTQDPCLPCS